MQCYPSSEPLVSITKLGPEPIVDPGVPVAEPWLELPAEPMTVCRPVQIALCLLMSTAKGKYTH